MSKATQNNQQTFSKKVFIALGMAALFILIILFAYFGFEVLFSLIVSILLAVFFCGVGNWMTR